MGAAWLPADHGRIIYYRSYSTLLFIFPFPGIANPFMILAIIASIVVFTYWAYYRVVYKREKEAWTDIERVAILLVVFLIVLWFILR